MSTIQPPLQSFISTVTALHRDNDDVTPAQMQKALELVPSELRGEPFRQFYVDVMAAWPINEDSKQVARDFVLSRLGVSVADANKHVDNPLVATLQKQLEASQKATDAIEPLANKLITDLSALYRKRSPGNVDKAIKTAGKLEAGLTGASNAAAAALSASKVVLDARAIPNFDIHGNNGPAMPMEPYVQAIANDVDGAKNLGAKLSEALRAMKDQLASGAPVEPQPVLALIEQVFALRQSASKAAAVADHFDGDAGKGDPTVTARAGRPAS